MLGHEPGAVFEADIPAAQEARLLRSGALAEATLRAERTTPPPKPESKKEE